MILNAILACDINNGIGFQGGLPWPHHKEDMKWFREWTQGGVVVMGRKTWESFGSKPLKNRYNVILSSKKDDTVGPQFTFVQNIDEVLEHLSSINTAVWIIGGKTIYEQTLHLCDRVYLTKFKEAYECDTFISQELLKPFQKLDHSEDKEDCSFTVWGK